MLDARRIKKLSEESFPGKDNFEGEVDLNVYRKEGYTKAMKDIKAKIEALLDGAESRSRKATVTCEAANGSMKTMDAYSYILLPDLKPLIEDYLG